ncbi:phage tail protein [Streptomyces sp. NPDC093272]|uniref:phage tail protein n=1 Tax=Streptomyces sp. NPDC093272 TaxID=3154981 RepID=UPI00341AE74A
MPEYLPPVVVEFEGRTSSFERAAEKVKADARRLKADLERFNAVLKVDAKLKDGALAEIRRRVSESPAAKLKVDLQLGAGQRDQLRAQLEGRPITANVKPVMDQEALRRVKTVLRELGKRIDVQIRPQMDTGAQARAQRRLDRMSQDRTVVIRTRVIGDANRIPGGGGGGRGAGWIGALVTFAPALAPIAAEAAAAAAAVGAATVAVGAFGAALKPQLSAMSDAAKAQGKYNDAVAKYGPASTQAADAQREMSQTLEGMPAATRQAAGAFQVLTGDFGKWSDGLAKFTMVPVTQGLAVLDALLPRLSPLVKDTSAQFTRLTTLLAGGIGGGAFDGMMSRFNAFATGALKAAVDKAVHLSRVLSEGGGGGAFQQFMAYAKANGPLVKDTLHNLSGAIQNIVEGASEAGPGMLTLVNALAKLVAALPPGVVASMLQVAAAIKAIGLARSGIDAVSGPIGTLRTRLSGLITTARNAGGGLNGLRAAFNSLSTGAKFGVAAAGVTALVLALHELSDNKAPVAVDELTTSLNTLVQTGKVTGALKTNLTEMSESIAMASKSASDNKFLQLTSDMGTWLGIAKGPGISDAKKNLDAWDKAMADNVKSGHVKEAAAQFDILKRSWVAGGGDLKRLSQFTDDYKGALADQKFEQKAAADAMGVFGSQAQRVQHQLDAQKQSADGLKQSIQALSDVSRSAFDAQTRFEEALDGVTKAIKENGKTLDVHTDKGRANRDALSGLASATEDAATKARENGSTWQTVMGIYKEGRNSIVETATSILGSKKAAEEYADSLLRIPSDASTLIKMNKEDAQRGLTEFNAAVKKTPDAKSVTLKTLSKGAESILAAFGYKVTHLPDGSVKVTARNGQALSGIADVRGALNSLDGKTATTYLYNKTINTIITNSKTYRSVHDIVGRAGGGLMPRRYATGDQVQFAPTGLLHGPGTGTSDDILTLFASGAVGRTSNTEFVVNAKETKKHLPLLEAINSGKLPKFAKGGLSQAAKDARNQLAGGFGISTFGRVAGYQKTPFEHALAASTDLSSLVSALNGFRGDIKKAFSGKTESSLLKQLDKAGKSLISYDKQLTKVTSSLASAKSKLDDLKSSAAQLKSSVASSIMSGASVVTQAPQEGFALSSADVVNNMNAQLQKASAFSAQLQQLKKRGLSADLLDQIAEAGVDQGGATAAALAGASDAQIKQLNSMQTQLKKSANAAGSAVSDAMYGAGIKAAEGLVAGLQKKQKSIEAAMLRIAKSMEGAIKRALKIKSPSQVMADLGDYTALGLAHGISRSSKHAVIAARGMAMSVQQGAALGASPAWTGIPAGGARRAGIVVHNHYHFKIEGNVRTIDGLARDVEAAFLQRGMRNPTTYQPYRR